jgi:glycosyltransferase involved in cell wall biosynthesis
MSDKKKILLLCDDIRMMSGIATMAREFVTGTAHKYDWVNIAGSVKHPDKGKILDMSQAVNEAAGIKDANVKLFPVDGYGNPDLLRQVIMSEKPDALLHFTDPRFWIWLYQMEHELRQFIPIMYYNIWDDVPYPMYNHSFYRSCDLLMGISRQTVNINRHVVGKDNWITLADAERGEKLNGRLISHWVPHGVDPVKFKKLTSSEDVAKVAALRKSLLKKDYNFVLFYNNRNIQRKRLSNIILGYRTFCDSLPKEQSAKCVLLLHTAVVDDAGTDLVAVKEALCPMYDIVYSDRKVSPEELNMMYNIADVTVSATSNEGWGIGTTESIMAETPVIIPVTGGQQDQIGQVDENGKPLRFEGNWGSNHDGRYKTHGVWAKPLWPATRVIQGSPITPYIFDDLVKWEDIASAMKYWYLAGPEVRAKAGAEGRRWACEEGACNKNYMCEQMSRCIDATMKAWTPRSRVTVHQTGEFVGNTMFNPNEMGFTVPTLDEAAIQAEVEDLKKKVAV